MTDAPCARTARPAQPVTFAHRATARAFVSGFTAPLDVPRLERRHTLIEHKVKEGECLSSIAEEYGFPWKKIWQHEANAELRDKRGDPNVLLTGDVVHIPERQTKTESASTEQRHKFCKPRGTELRLKMLDRDFEPRGNEPYALEVDGLARKQDKTDGEGMIRCKIDPVASRALVHLTRLDEVYEVELGAVSPVDETKGVQERLYNLGIDCGPVDGIWGDLTEGGVQAFKKRNGESDPDGDLDDETRRRLKEVHGS